MKLDVIKTIRIDDLKNAGGEIPPWMDTLLGQINSFIEGVGRAIQGNLTFGDNLSCAVKTYTLTHGVELVINPNSPIRVLGVVPIDYNGQTLDKFGWSRKTNGLIGVTAYYSGGTATTSSSCTLIILLG
jgi:hypothetical protein